jgi:NitT/TauT family transport system substrate-binding protein
MARRTFSLLIGAALCVPPRAAQGQNATLRIGTLGIEPAAQAYYAKDMGFFAKAGIDVDVQTLTAGTVSALISNAIDVAYTAVDTLPVLRQKDIPVVVIAPAAEFAAPATARLSTLMVPLSSTARTAKDLNGKVVAVSVLHSISEDSARVWIDRNGGDSSTVKFVEVPFPAMSAALQATRIDAAQVPEPFISEAKKNGRVLAYLFEDIAQHFLLAVWVATPQWASAHPELVKRFAAVMTQTAAWANTNPGKSGEILAKYTHLDPATIGTMTRAHFGEQLTPALIQPLIDVSAKYNGVSSFPAQQLMYGQVP